MANASVRQATRRGGRPSADEPKSWHLAETADEQALAQLEFGMERLIHAYYRWKVNCLATLGDFGLTGDDITILNIIRMGDEPKKMIEVARILNRNDMANLQYATRKLIKAGLVEKLKVSSRRDTTYRTTEYGIEVTDHYAAMRRKLVIAHLGEVVGTDDKLAMLGTMFDDLIQVYEQGVGRATSISARLVELKE